MSNSEYRILVTIQLFTLSLLIIVVVDRYMVIPTAPIVSYELPSKKNDKISLRVDSTQNKVYGKMRAPNTLTIFSNYNCTYCRLFYRNVLDSLLNGPVKDGNLKVVCRDFVSHTDKLGSLMSKVVETARLHGKFQELHNTYINEATSLDSATIVRSALNAGLTLGEIDEGLNSESVNMKIKRDYEAAVTLGATATPFFLINEQKITGYLFYKDIVKIIE